MSTPKNVWAAGPLLALSLPLTATAFGCGPGGFASDGGSFGEGGTELGSSDTTTATTDPPTTSATSADPETGTGTDSDTSNWLDTETGSETETGDPEPIDPPQCERTWTHVDTTMTHGHIGATPIGPRPDGGFVSVNPVIGAGNDDVNVDAWFRSWSSTGELEWERLVSWADHRDDPLVLTQDELADLFIGGRTNANMVFEDAMVAALDGLDGEPRWVFLRHETGGYSSLVHTGAALLAAGRIGDALELMAFDPDTGAVLWSAVPELGFENGDTRGLVMDGGLINMLVTGGGEVQIVQLEPPDTAAKLLVSLANGSELAPHDLEPLGANALAALYSVGPSSFLDIVDRSNGQPITSLALDDLIELLPEDFGLATNIQATELVETPGGLALAGMLSGEDIDSKTFVLRLDAELTPLCVGVMGKEDVEGLFHTPLLRGLTVGPTGELVTDSFAVNPRHSVFARWN